MLLSDGMLASPLAEALRRHNPDLTILCAQTEDELRQGVAANGPFDRLVGFCTQTIVPPAVLDALRGPAYNFHPASPGYPGSHPASFAVYDGATRFGATAHEMAARVDAGSIVDVEWFDIAPRTGALALENQAGEAAARQFWRLAPLLARCREPLRHIDARWGSRKTTRRDFRAMGALDPMISADEFERRWRAFGELDPTIMHVVLHGRRFALTPESEVVDS